MAERTEVAAARRWVVKVGSALLTDDGRGLDERMICTLVEQLVQLRGQGCEVVLVSSGAVAAGIVRLGWTSRPHLLHELQAAAAVGQSVMPLIGQMMMGQMMGAPGGPPGGMPPSE